MAKARIIEQTPAVEDPLDAELAEFFQDGQGEGESTSAEEIKQALQQEQAELETQAQIERQAKQAVRDANKHACLNPRCEGVEESRGLCSKCLTMARKLVKAGEVTWAQLESAGMAKPAKVAFAPTEVSIQRKSWLLSARQAAPQGEAPLPPLRDQGIVRLPVGAQRRVVK